MLGKEPKIKVNPTALSYRYCTMCGAVISDDDCSKSDLNLCKVCAGEVCTYNERHKVMELISGFYCKDCKKMIKETKYYRRWVDNNIKVDEAIITYI